MLVETTASESWQLLYTVYIGRPNRSQWSDVKVTDRQTDRQTQKDRRTDGETVQAVVYTVYGKPQTIARFPLDKLHLKPPGAGERLLQDTHDVNPRPLVELTFLPHCRVVEHSVAVHVKLAVEYHLTAGCDVILPIT